MTISARRTGTRVSARIRSARRIYTIGVVNAGKRIDADASGIARFLSCFTSKASDTYGRSIDGSALRRVSNDSGRSRGLAVSTDSVGAAVGTVVSGDGRLGSLLVSTELIGVTLVLTNLSLRVANGLAVGIGTEIRSASRGGSTAIVSSTDGAAGGAVDALSGSLTVGTRGSDAVTVEGAGATNTSNRVANLLVLSCSTIQISTISVGCASLASLIFLTIGSTIGNRAVLGSTFSYVSGTSKGINTLT